MSEKNIKEYVVKKDGQVLKTYRSLPAAKQLAEKEIANVYCDGICVYRTVPDEEDAETTTATEEKEEKLPAPPAKFTLTAKMNVRKTPSLNADIVGVKENGTVVDVDSVVDDWLYLTDGTYIYYNGGKFAKKTDA